MYALLKGYTLAIDKATGEGEAGPALGQAHQSTRKKRLPLWISCGQQIGKLRCKKWRLLGFYGTCCSLFRIIAGIDTWMYRKASSLLSELVHSHE